VLFQTVSVVGCVFGIRTVKPLCGKSANEPAPGLISISSVISRGSMMSIGSPVALAHDAQARPHLCEERRLSAHGVHSFANSTLAAANHLGCKGAFELRSLIRKRNQTNQLQT
jgi:hypothetical protein